jgi:hypothetical protein
LVVSLQRIVRVVELAGAVMVELGNSQGSLIDALAGHCREFMLSMKVALNPHPFHPELDPVWPLLACSEGFWIFEH